MKSIKKKRKENQDPSPGETNPRQKLRQTQKKEMAPREKTLGAKPKPSLHAIQRKTNFHTIDKNSPRLGKENNIIQEEK